MRDSNAIINQLAEFAREQNLVERAFKHCSAYLHNVAADGDLPRNLHPSDVQMKFRSQAFCFESSLLSYPFFTTSLDLYVNEEAVGEYRLIVRLDGQNDDDYLIFYPLFDEEGLEERSI